MSTIRLGRPRSALLPTLVIAAVLVILFAIFTNIWTDRIWFESFEYGIVFNTMLLTRVGLFGSFGLLMAAVVAANVAIAYRLRPRVRGAGPASPLLERYREVLETRLVLVIVGLGVVVGLFAGATATGQVFNYLQWQNSTPFGITDPVFGFDLGFYAFDYPWWRFTMSFAFIALLFSAAAAAIIHYLMGGLRLVGPNRGGSAGAQAHLSILVGLAVIVRGVGYWFDQYGLNIADTPIFTGMNFTADNATRNADFILAIIAGLCALMFFANAVIRRWSVPIIGLTLMVLSAIILGVVYPAGVQLIQVRANEPVRERPYIERNIEATRAAYGVDDVQIDEYEAKTTATAGQLRSDAEALPGIRLIDPAVVGPAYEQLQQVRGYYQFSQILDVDRYTIDNEETDAVVAVREMDHEGLESQNWNSLKRIYTHGYGLVAAYGNRRGAGGEPSWIIEDIPPTGKITDFEPRIYYGELQDDYSLVGAPEGTEPVEFDTPSGSEGNPSTYTYTGEGGVPVGDLWHRLLYAAKFADPYMLLSTELNSESKIIYDRTPRERVMKAAPWLRVDSDIYPAIVDGRIVWVVDGYTTSNSYPYSQRVNLEEATSDTQTRQGALPPQPDSMINYMRNSVKATVDAYDGTVNLYEWDDSDPVLQTWKKAFPGLVKDKSEISDELLQHLRYPSDLYKVQREILARYHVTDPNVWYQNSDLWRVPEDPLQDAPPGAKETPKYLSIKWPGDDAPLFSLTSTYVPDGRANLIGYMAVNADASSPDYGQLRILQMSEETQIDGPGQTANVFNTNETVAERLRPFYQGAAAVRFGNLLTLPLGGGLVYVQPVYTERDGSTGSYPVLRFVLVRFGSTVAIGDTLQDALDQVFKGDAGASTDEEEGEAPPPTQEPQDPGEEPQSSNPEATAALAEANKAFQDAEAALKNGDLGTYQTKIREAEAAMKRAEEALNG